jgi:hypothetical protein
VDVLDHDDQRPARRDRLEEPSPGGEALAAPHAAAGPKRNEQTIGSALAGRKWVRPGMRGITTKGISTAA